MVRNPSGFREDGGDPSPSKRASRERPAKDARVYKGLCVNCAKRDACLLPECEGGVWHCDQYVEEC